MQKSARTSQLIADSVVENVEVGKEVKLRGICRVCRNATTCTFPRDPSRAILNCDEFEGIEPTQKNKLEITRTKNTSVPIQQKSVSSADTNTFAGLCVNCDRRETCQFPKPEGGVWNCDEYE